MSAEGGQVRPDAGSGRGLARVDAVVHGYVHGVGFRYFVATRASALGLGGWVANELDGTVHCVAEGPRGDLEELIRLLEMGPGMASVDHVSVAWMPATGAFAGFEIRSWGHRGD